MKQHCILAIAVFALLLFPCNLALADTFGTGANQFTLDFVPISGSTNPTPAQTTERRSRRFRHRRVRLSHGHVRDHQRPVEQVQGRTWAFRSRATRPSAYDEDFYDWGTGTTDVPTNRVSWYEAAQFVNWLNTSTGHQAAYKFTGTQGRATTRLPRGTPRRPGAGRTSIATRTHSISCRMRMSGSRRLTGTARRSRTTRRSLATRCIRVTAPAVRDGTTATVDTRLIPLAHGTSAAGARNSMARTT